MDNLIAKTYKEYFGIELIESEIKELSNKYYLAAKGKYGKLRGFNQALFEEKMKASKAIYFNVDEIAPLIIKSIDLFPDYWKNKKFIEAVSAMNYVLYSRAVKNKNWLICLTDNPDIKLVDPNAFDLIKRSYKIIAMEVVGIVQREFANAFTNIVEQVTEEVKNKAKKRYGKDTWLIVNINANVASEADIKQISYNILKIKNNPFCCIVLTNMGIFTREMRMDTLFPKFKLFSFNLKQ